MKTYHLMLLLFLFSYCASDTRKEENHTSTQITQDTSVNAQINSDFATKQKSINYTYTKLKIDTAVIEQEHHNWEGFDFHWNGNAYILSSDMLNASGSHRYSGTNLFDGNPNTVWFDEQTSQPYAYFSVDRDLDNLNIIIANGYQKNDSLFKKYNRAKHLQITFYIGFKNIVCDDTEVTGPDGWEEQAMSETYPITAIAYPVKKTIELKDTVGYQAFSFPFNEKELAEFNEKVIKQYVLEHQEELLPDNNYSALKNFYFIKVQIEDTYNEDQKTAALSDLFLSTKEYVDINEPVTKISMDEERNLLLIKTDAQTYTHKIKLNEGEKALLKSVSPDKKWVIVSTINRKNDTVNALFFIPKLKNVTANAMQLYDMGSPVDFSTISGELLIRFDLGKIKADEFFKEINSIHEIYESYSFANISLEALAYLFTDAINKHNRTNLLALIDTEYLPEFNNDTSAAINNLFFGYDEKAQKNVQINFQKAKVLEAMIRKKEKPAFDGDIIYDLILKVTDETYTIKLILPIGEHYYEIDDFYPVYKFFISPAVD